MNARAEIEAAIPHRDPFLFVDRILDRTATTLLSEWTIPEDAAWFRGHYPGEPVMPGVLLSEHVFQTAAVLVSETLGGFSPEDGIPVLANLFLWSGAGGGDGMPVVFSTEIDPTTLQAGDLNVVSASGQIRPVPAVTMAPAIDLGELRTALCLGQLGTPEDPPARVEVVGHVLALDGRSYQGAAVDVIPLAAGPSPASSGSRRARSSRSSRAEE